MPPFLSKSFGAIGLAEYVRHFLFGLMFVGICYASDTTGRMMADWRSPIFLGLNALLYPYSRASYEVVVEYILGRNELLIDVPILLLFKFVSMFICWFFAGLIAPIGLLALWLYNSISDQR